MAPRIDPAKLHEQRGSKTLVAYDLAADGPTVFVDVLTHEHLERFLRLFGALASGRALRVVLQDEDFVRLEGIDVLELDATAEEGEPAKPISRFDRAVYWSRSVAGWQDIVAMLEAIDIGRQRSHRYLSSSFADDIEIEFAYLEPHSGSKER